ncbi:MAG: hypothetical protein RLZZ155_1566 [Bacteroidota bacterium]
MKNFLSRSLVAAFVLVVHSASAFQFPAGTVWFNTDYQFNTDLLKDKLVVLGCLQPEEITGIGAMVDLQEEFLTVPQVQLITLIPARDPAYSRQEIFDFIQQNGISHPVGIVPNWGDIPMIEGARLPQFLVFEKKMKDSVVGIQGVLNMETLSASIMHWVKADVNSYSLWQPTVTPEPKHWANPLIELPNDLCYFSGELAVSEPALFRVSTVSEDGLIQKRIGGVRGYADGDISVAQMKKPMGVTFSYAEQLLYIADPLNHAIRIYDNDQHVLLTILGNGKLPNIESFEKATTWKGAIPYPTDVFILKNKIYVLAGNDCSVWELNTADQSSKLIWRSESKDAQGNALSALSLQFMNKEFYMLKSNGSISKFKKKKEQVAYAPATPLNRAGGFTFYNGDLVVSEPFNHKVSWLGNVNNRAGSGVLGLIDGAADTAQFTRPMALNKIGSEIFVCEGGYGVLRKWRMVSNEVKSFYPMVSQEALYSGESPNAGEAVALEPITVEPGKTVLKLSIDAPGYFLLNQEENGVFIDENSGVSASAEQLTDGKINLTLEVSETRTEMGFIQLGLQLVLHPEDAPKMTYLKRMFVVFTYEILPGSEHEQELVIHPFVKPN